MIYMPEIFEPSENSSTTNEWKQIKHNDPNIDIRINCGIASMTAKYASIHIRGIKICHACSGPKVEESIDKLLAEYNLPELTEKLRERFIAVLNNL